jgi:hypothetical protein
MWFGAWKVEYKSVTVHIVKDLMKLLESQSGDNYVHRL